MSSFDKIIGYEKQKEELIMLSDTLKNEEKYKELGIKIPKAILIYGQPGLGKTLMANCLIEDCNRKTFYCKKDRADKDFIVEIKNTFDKAIQNQPSIVFLDDMDKFAQDNFTEDSNKEEFVAIQSYLEDIADKSVFVIATANNIFYLPDSLLRAGRFGRQMELFLPKSLDAIKIISYYIQNKHISSTLSPEEIYYIVNDCSCAVLEEIINEAGLYAVYQGKKEIDKDDIIKATIRVTTNEIETNGYNDIVSKKSIAFHEVGHAVVAMALGKKIGFLTIKTHGFMLGVCSCSTQLEKPPSYEELMNRVMVGLGGKASVDLFLNIVDVGTQSDFKNCKSIVINALKYSATSGFDYTYMSFGMDNNSEKRTSMIEDEGTRILNELYKKTKRILAKNKDIVQELVDKVLEKETLSYDEIIDYTDKICK